MNKWVKRKWVAALKSGEYAQGRGYLVTQWYKEQTQHCCLGVLACEMVPEFVKARGAVDPIYGVDGQTDTLPDDLAVMFGLDEALQSALAEMNDGGKSFLAIANWIDENL